MKSLNKVVKMIVAGVVVDENIDVDILSPLIKDIEKDNNLPIIEECEVCE
tara:strand:+ start:522 stop:671 length:150 start_codon:yes stop_codon:yes gene_type:complete